MKQNIAQIFLKAKTYIYIYNIQQCSQKVCCKEGNNIFMIKYFIKIIIRRNSCLDQILKISKIYNLHNDLLKVCLVINLF